MLSSDILDEIVYDMQELLSVTVAFHKDHVRLGNRMSGEGQVSSGHIANQLHL